MKKRHLRKMLQVIREKNFHCCVSLQVKNWNFQPLSGCLLQQIWIKENYFCFKIQISFRGFFSQFWKKTFGVFKCNWFVSQLNKFRSIFLASWMDFYFSTFTFNMKDQFSQNVQRLTQSIFEAGWALKNIIWRKYF